MTGDVVRKKPGRGANLAEIARSKKPRRKAGERLTDTTVDQITKPGYHNDGNGLYLSVSAKGAKSWVFRFKWEGKLKEMGLGPFPSISLDAARADRDTWRRVYQIDGLNPIEIRRELEAAKKDEEGRGDRERAEAEARRTAATFEACATAYVDGQEEGWKNAKHRQQWRNTLKEYCAPIWGKDVADITNIDVQGVLAPIWLTKHETASRLRGRIERVLAFAKVKGLRTGENPARWKENLDHMLPQWKRRLVRGHHKAKPHEKVKELVAELRGIETVSALALEFTILAAKRTTEVKDMVWNEIDHAARVWTIPPGRMKMNELHREPLTGRQMEILSLMAEMRTPADQSAPGGGYVFKGLKPGRPISSGTMYQLLKRKMKHDATVHGFRSSFRDWVADATTFPRELAEMALAHKVADDTEEAYWRSDGLEKRRKIMEAWATYVEPNF
ncbi:MULTISPECIES: site-specific integrase [Asticcacaulis]|uniref:tyrosine-type recombinase/integrase n=1 Tax=Asticcacaulis TaxID=76890 RepID=UPI001AE37395|nr:MULTISPECIES: site-specific integrase [Asticcacaulis]MBP2159587.1 integrase [Asticcacaulis solisilvae]MDR6800586.1 integrase [Asticcacaulis sp. BE141]